MSRFEPIVRSWSAISRPLPQFAPARRPHARRRPMLECLESRSLLSAITLAVNTLADAPSSPGVTTLRGAITQADADTADNYVIKFAVRGVIDLITALPNLANNISIRGPGAANLTIQRDPNAVPFSVLTVDNSETVTISGVTILGGKTAGAGGGIDDTGTTGALTVNNVVLISNSAAIEGGGMFSGGLVSATVSQCVFYGNSSPNGGGLAGDSTVSNSYFSDNSAFGQEEIPGGGTEEYGEGGAINAGNVTVSNCVFDSNSSVTGGAIANIGDLTVNASVFKNNTAVGGGGGIDGSGITMTVVDNCFIGNSASIGGGVLASSISTVTNNVFAFNTAGVGGGIWTENALTVTGNLFYNGNRDCSKDTGLSHHAALALCRILVV